MHSLVALRNHRMLVAMFLLGGAAIVLLCVFDPATSGVFPPCPVRYLTGLYCPGCGSLRALHALLHGELGRAFAMNPLMIVTLPFVTYWFSLGSASRTARKGLARGHTPRKLDSRFLCCGHSVRRGEKSSSLSLRLVSARSDVASLMKLLAKGESW